MNHTYQTHTYAHTQISMPHTHTGMHSTQSLSIHSLLDIIVHSLHNHVVRFHLTTTRQQNASFNMYVHGIHSWQQRHGAHYLLHLTVTYSSYFLIPHIAPWYCTYTNHVPFIAVGIQCLSQPLLHFWWTSTPQHGTMHRVRWWGV